MPIITLHEFTPKVAALHQVRAAFDTKNFHGNTVLQLAVCGDDAQMLQVLLAARCSSEETDASGQTIMQDAVCKGSSAVVNTLFALRADVSAVDARGRSLLALAAGHGHLDVARVLCCHPTAPPEICVAAKRTSAKASGPVAGVFMEGRHIDT